MRVVRFYLDQPLSRGELLLDGDPAHYLGRVLRLRPGDQVQAFNGSGQEWPGEVVTVNKRDLTLQLGEPFAGLAESP
ncbi:MAG: 16S rRNA (uracil(1498)-N(3))-methyltransferase, partial [Pseudomonadaceae bacterium]